MTPAIDHKAMPGAEVLDRAAAFDPTTHTRAERIYKLALQVIARAEALNELQLKSFAQYALDEVAKLEAA